MRPRSLAITGLLTAALLSVPAAVAVPDVDLPGNQPLTNDHAYVFTQQQRDNVSWWNGTWLPQTVPSGAHMQVQLPSDPVRWIPELGPDCQPSRLLGLVPTWVLPLRARVELNDQWTLPSPGRLEGSSAVSVFDYHVHGVGIAALCLRPEPVPDNPEVLGFPADTPPYYVATVVVGIPQITVP
ncbi:hypothetical protein [Amycolatopsis cihanbeyliensis]|uniref:Secreted protein n=1 Tax=Amycolatopsis cihanbeyliensis TaxID=1128664 RepID=A0A542DF98_AMYCI|nr:hypothetical protein [Amycolatopsis cihanbeyliensis]TQJ01730.1 hypothetical protein FB471_1439 [Amycolatopsis cihanbeyliensis]